MRSLLISIAAFGLLTGPVAALAQPTPSAIAPADEYFGSVHESVLEIRNRLGGFDRKSDAEVKMPDALGALDDVQDAVMDWQHKYPADPWVIDAMARLLECYARAGAPQDPRANALMELLVADYPRSAVTGEALLAMIKATTPTAPAPAPAAAPSSPAAAAEIVGDVVDAATGAPVPGAVVIVAPNHESNDLKSSPFAMTASDGSFSVKGVPLGSSFTAGPIALEHAEYIVVEPPPGSAYTPYHGMIDAAGGRSQAGVIRLAER